MKDRKREELLKSILIVFCIALFAIIFFVLLAFNQALENTLEKGYDFLDVLDESINYKIDTYGEILFNLSQDDQFNKVLKDLSLEDWKDQTKVNILKTILKDRFVNFSGISTFTIGDLSDETLVNIDLSFSSLKDPIFEWQKSQASNYEYSLVRGQDEAYLIIKTDHSLGDNEVINLYLTVAISEIIGPYWRTFGYQINIMDESNHYYMDNHRDDFNDFFESKSLDSKNVPFFSKDQNGLSVSDLHYRDKRLFFIKPLDTNHYLVMIKPYSKYDLSNIQNQVYTHLLVYIFLGFSVVGYFIFNHEKTMKWIEKDRVFLNEIIDMDKIQISELKKELIFYQKMIEKAPIPILFVDKNSLNVVNANEKVMSFYGYSLSEIIQLTLPDLCKMESIEYDNPKIHVEHQLADHTKKEGHIRLQECSFGETDLLVVHLTSTIHIPKKEESDIKYEIFHEIRSPLQGAYGAVDLIDQASDAYKEYTEIIKNSLNDVLILTENVLSQGKLMGDHEKLYIEDFELKSLLNEVVQLIYYQDKHYNYISSKINKKINSKFVEVDQYTIRGDRMKLKQILINLMSNASKYTHDGQISLEVEIENIECKDKLLFRVTDTGQGLSKEAQSELFASYKTFHDSSKVSSTGLGLFVTKKYLEMLGSSIEIESELNKGSTFIFQLESQSVKNNFGETYEDCSVLVVDDDSVSCGFLKHLLEKERHCLVKSLTNEGDLMNELSRRNYSILIIDENLNNFKGRDLINLIRNSMNQRLQSMPIILMSASNQLLSEDYEVIKKPFNSQVILECIDRLLRVPQSIGQDLYPIIDEDILRDTMESVGKDVFKKLLNKFLMSAKEDLQEIDALIEKKAYKDIGEILHRFKGSLSYFGSVKCQPLLDDLEGLLEEDPDLFVKTYDVFKESYEEFEKELIKIN